MAEIPVHKRTGMPGCVWLILGLVLVALLWWIFSDRDNRNDVVATPTDTTAPLDTAVFDPATPDAMTPIDTVALPDPTVVDPTAPDVTLIDNTTMPAAGVAGPVTDLDTIINATDGSLVGRNVNLSNVLAGTVLTDAGFWITNASGKRVYAVLEEILTPNTPIEGQIDVDKGDRINVQGTIRSATGGAHQDAAIPGPTKPLPAGISHYIYVQTATRAR